MTREEILLKSAKHLQEYSTALRECTTVNGEWPQHDDADRRAKADHDEMVMLAAALIAMGRTA